jgi:hypothetical protein
MKIELVLETRPNQDQFYWIKKDGRNISGCCVYAGNRDTNKTEDTEGYLDQAIKMYDRVVDGTHVGELLIKSVVIEDKSTEI